MTTNRSPHPSPLTNPAVEERLHALAGPEHVFPAGVEDAVAGVGAEWVVEPGSEREAASLLRFASEAGLSVIPRGGGTKLCWGNPPASADVILSLRRMNRVLEHAWADLTVTVEAGCTLGQLQKALAKHGQRLAADPLWPERATVGGVLSANDTGALRLSHGGLRDLIIGVTLALADGTLAKSGGKVVKNVAGYDLPKLATGALGTLGVITQAIFRVHPQPADARTLSLEVENQSEMQRVILDLLGSNLPCAAIQARLAGGKRPTIDIGLEGSDTGLSAQETAIRGLLHPKTISLGNAEVWLARQELWTASRGDGAIAKVSVLPSQLGAVAASLERLAETRRARWRAVLQATGIGWVRLETADEDRAGIPLAILGELRAEIAAGGGSLTVLRAPSGAGTTDVWGDAGDALPLMARLKQQLDPQRTLNPGRFIGGI